MLGLVTSSPVGVLTLRVLAESKALLLFIFSLYEAGIKMRKASDASACATATAGECAGVAVCTPLIVCVQEKADGYTFGFDLNVTADIVGIVVLLTFFVGNLAVLLAVSCFHVRDRDEEWHKNDIALCYEMNRQFGTPYMQRVRYANFGIVSGTTVYAFIMSIIRGTFVDVAIGGGYCLLMASVFSFNLWAAEKSLLGIPFSVFRKRSSAFAFTLGDLSYSAPDLCLQKLTKYARDEEMEEMHEERQQLKA